jgi:hypothetical protein
MKEVALQAPESCSLGKMRIVEKGIFLNISRLR